MSTLCDYDIPKEKRPEGSRNFPLVFPSYADTHSDGNSLRGSFNTETSGRSHTESDQQVPATRGFPAYGKAIPWLDAEYPFEKTTAIAKCPDPESDGQESTTSNTPKVVLPPLTKEQHDSDVHTPIRDYHRQMSQFSLGPGDLFHNRPQGRFIRGPPGITHQSQDRSHPGLSCPPGPRVPAQSSDDNDTFDSYFKPSHRQIVTDPRQIVVNSPTFNAQYAPMQARHDKAQEDFWLGESLLADSPLGEPMAPDTPGSQPPRRSQRVRKLQRRRQNLADRMAREEAARGFDSEDDNEFYPHAD
ncbi:hypothetical protein F4805DRAFT_477246 [Annulohypoxylon moriforme]|nr:hypothetical protein F4805DRAFT_477246 [Annulohypoxylon moriforme]